MASERKDNNAPRTGENTRRGRTYPHSTGDRSVMRDHGVEKRDYEGGVQRQPNLDRPGAGEQPGR